MKKTKSPSSRDKRHKIRIYSTPTCPYCHTLKTFLDEKGFQYEDVDVSADEKAMEEMIKKSDQMSVPVIEIDGEVIVGFDKTKVSELLNIKE